MLIERIRVDGQYFEHSHHLGILLNWQYQYGADAHFFGQLGVHPPIGIRVVAEQHFASTETKPGQAGARLQMRPNFWSGGTGGRLGSTQRLLC